MRVEKLYWGVGNITVLTSSLVSLEPFNSPDQVSCFSVETKEIICIKREINSDRTNMNTTLPEFSLFGCRDVM